MANETVVKLGTTKTLEANGASVTNNSLVQANDAAYSIAADGAYYPDAIFVLTCTYATAPTEGSVISLYARRINVDGTADEDVPETTRLVRFIGSFVVNNVTTSQVLVIEAYDVPIEAEYYILNNGTGQTISAGWTLKVTPKTLGPA